MEFLPWWDLFEKHDHIECLKQEVAKWRCIINDFLCKKLAYIKLEEHLMNPERNK